MSCVTSLYMPCIESNYCAHNMIDAFYSSGIATLSRVSYEPYLFKDNLYYRAYADVCEWHDTESSRNFRNKICDDNLEARFIYEDDNWFVVRQNFRPWVTHEPDRFCTAVNLFMDCASVKQYNLNNEEEVDSFCSMDYSLSLDDELTIIDDTDDDNHLSLEYPSDDYEQEYDEEYMKYLEEEDFKMDAEYYHNEIMEERINARKTMTLQEFKIWEFNKSMKMSDKEGKYDIYLKTGQIFK